MSLPNAKKKEESRRRSHYAMKATPAGPVKWRCTFNNTILEVLKNRTGWVESKNANEWDFLWCGRDWMNNSFLKHIFQDKQRVCHFRNGYELCRKDNLVRNVKKIRRQLERDGHHEDATKYDFLPASYVLPNDYHLFLEEFRQHPHNTLWIMKPVSGAQGRGIFLFRKLKDITEWKKNDAFNKSGVESYIVQSYIDKPYLIGGKKFDIRIYVLVTSFQPLTAWLHRDGFARLSHTRYSLDSISDAFVHLTNVAIAKTAPDYDPEIGLKWSPFKLRRYLTARHGIFAVMKFLQELGWILIRSLRAVEKQIIQDRHCFELYGYDILLDEDLKPWLLEVNGSPSLTASSQEDWDMKTRVLSQTIDVVDMERKLGESERQVGGFDLFLENGHPVLSAPTGNQEFDSKAFQHIVNIQWGLDYCTA